MTTTRTTSRQLKGEFNALRATKTHTVAQSIDIAAGNYGSNKYFGGAYNISSSSWIGASDTFYIYLDKDDSLILDGSSFPYLSTRIATIIISTGNIQEIIDQRAEVNGLIDGYEVRFDDTNTTVAVGDSIQEAIESLDAYVASISSSTGSNIQKYWDFDIEGASRNGFVLSGQVSDSPTLDMPDGETGIARIRYSVSVPKDYVTGTDIVIKVFWSAATASVGNVNWNLKYRLVASNSENIDIPLTTVNFTQATPGTTNRLTDTNSNLSIAEGDINPNDILIINIEREYTIIDTYNSTIRIHLVRMEYTGRGII